MLFPNFYVSSLNVSFGVAVKRSRMSLSHSGGLKQIPGNFTFLFTRCIPAARHCHS